MRVWSQKATLGAGLSHILGAGDEVSSDCYDHVHSTGFGPRATVSMLSGRGTVTATAHAYWFSRGATCALDPFVPRDGTYEFDDGVSLLAVEFITTDVRFELEPVRRFRIGAGGGVAWREGRNVPYGLVEMGAALISAPLVRLWINGELDAFRFSKARRLDTFQNFAVVSSQPLGITRHWSTAFVVGVHVEFPLP
jgi:hypothetical protein